MQTFSVELWLVLLGVTGVGSVAMLFVLAQRFGRERQLHDLRVRVAEVRAAYIRRMEEINARERGEAGEGNE